MDRTIFDNLLPRKQEVLKHFEDSLGLMVDEAYYFLSPLAEGDTYSIDIAVFSPSESCDYYVATTVGLSCYQFSSIYARSELFIVLPKNYKVDLSKKENSWPIEFLHEFAYLLLDSKKVPMINQVYEVFEKGHFRATNANSAIVVFCEMFDSDIIETKIGDTFTRFFQVVPISTEQVKKIEEVGIDKFVEYDLHDTEGPDMVVRWAPKTNKKIEKIIEHNEKSLKGKLK